MVLYPKIDEFKNLDASVILINYMHVLYTPKFIRKSIFQFSVKVMQLFSYIIYLNIVICIASIFSYLHKQRPTLLANRKDVTLK